jgi:hypothetical protein
MVSRERKWLTASEPEIRAVMGIPAENGKKGKNGQQPVDVRSS